VNTESSIYRRRAKDKLQVQRLGLVDRYKLNDMISSHKWSFNEIVDMRFFLNSHINL